MERGHITGPGTWARVTGGKRCCEARTQSPSPFLFLLSPRCCFSLSLSHFHYFFPLCFRGFDPSAANTTHRQAKQASPIHTRYDFRPDEIVHRCHAHAHAPRQGLHFSAKFGSNAPFLESSDPSKIPKLEACDDDPLNTILPP